MLVAIIVAALCGPSLVLSETCEVKATLDDDLVLSTPPGRSIRLDSDVYYNGETATLQAKIASLNDQIRALKSCRIVSAPSLVASAWDYVASAGTAGLSGMRVFNGNVFVGRSDGLLTIYRVQPSGALLSVGTKTMTGFGTPAKYSLADIAENPVTKHLYIAWTCAGAGCPSVSAPSFGLIEIVDVSDLTSPIRLGFFDKIPGSLTAIVFVPASAVVGSKPLIVTSESKAGASINGMRALDVSNPSAPVQIGNALTPTMPNNMVAQMGDMKLLRGSIVAVSAWQDCELIIFDVGNPAVGIVERGRRSCRSDDSVQMNAAFAYPISYALTRLDTAGTILAMGLVQLYPKGNPGFMIYNTSNPSSIVALSPIVMTTSETNASPHAMFSMQNGRYLVIFHDAMGPAEYTGTTRPMDNGIYVFDLLDITSPKAVALVPVPKISSVQPLSNSTVVAVTSDGNILVYKLFENCD